MTVVSCATAGGHVQSRRDLKEVRYRKLKGKRTSLRRISAVDSEGRRFGADQMKKERNRT